MTHQHKRMASGYWNRLTLVEQMANIGSEVERTISWKKKKNNEYSWKALERTLELLDLTISCKNNIKRLKELTRLREALIDYFAGDNQFSSSDELWQKYFFAFNYNARMKMG